MTTSWTPRPMQAPMLQHLQQHKRCALFARPGTGKTSATLTAVDQLSVVEDVYPALVLAPLRVARDVWSTEAGKWEHLKHLRVSAAIGDRAVRDAAFKTRAEIYTINYDNLEELVDRFDGKWPFRTVIADESTRLKSFRFRNGGRRALALSKIAHRYPIRWINLTGTPSPNGLADLWGQTWFLDAGLRLGRTFTAFQQRWFYPSVTGHGWVPMDHAMEQVQKALSDICLTVDPKDYYDLREPIVTPVYVKLPGATAARYREMEKKFFTEINGQEITAVHAGAKSMKLLQLANGAVYTNPETGAWEEVHQEKLEALDEIIEESAGEPVMVAYHFRSDLERLKKRYPDAAVLSEKRGLEIFKAGGAAIGLAHPASLGHGIDGLQNVCNTLVYFSHDWNLENREQILERIGPMRQLQAGLDRPVYVYNIIAEGTLDEVVIDRCADKSSVQEALMRYMKRGAQ